MLNIEVTKFIIVNSCNEMPWSLEKGGKSIYTDTENIPIILQSEGKQLR